MDIILPSIKILGTKITTAPKEDILEFLLKSIKKRVQKLYIVTPNPEIIVAASRSKGFQEVLNGAAVSLPDGIGIVLAGNILKKGVKGRITGVDFMQDLCKESVREGFTIGLLGGRRGVAEKVSECLKKKWPDLRVIMATETWPENDIADLASHTRQSPPIDILFVALGAPKQEEWIAKNLPHINVTCAMGVGGAFDYLAGLVPRAPRVVRKIGMEWAFRLALQPWRIKRQFALPVFAIKVLKEKFFSGA